MLLTVPFRRAAVFGEFFRAFAGRFRERRFRLGIRAHNAKRPPEPRRKGFTMTITAGPEAERHAASAPIRPRATSRPTLLAFDIVGKIDQVAIEEMAHRIDAAFAAYDRIDILLIMLDFEGMETAALFDPDALGAQARSIRHVRKYGVVGAPAWARAMIEVFDFVSPVDAKTFDLAEEADAWAWVET
jgi:hypothetical protein